MVHQQVSELRIHSEKTRQSRDIYNPSPERDHWGNSVYITHNTAFEAESANFSDWLRVHSRLRGIIPLSSG